MSNLLKYLYFIFFSISVTSYSQQYWIRQPSPTHYSLAKCTFVDSLYGWAAGDSGTVISTTNNGISWTIQNTGIARTQIDNIFFLNRRLGWALSNDYSTQGTFYLKTTNGGQTWSNSRFFDTTLYLSAIFFTDSINGYLVDLTGHILKTTNSGLNWNYCNVDSNACYMFPVMGLNFLNVQTGYAWRRTHGSNWDYMENNKCRFGMELFLYCPRAIA